MLDSLAVVFALLLAPIAQNASVETVFCLYRDPVPRAVNVTVLSDGGNVYKVKRCEAGVLGVWHNHPLKEDGTLNDCFLSPSDLAQFQYGGYQMMVVDNTDEFCWFVRDEVDHWGGMLYPDEHRRHKYR